MVSLAEEAVFVVVEGLRGVAVGWKTRGFNRVA
jgi:hypothetical protein